MDVRRRITFNINSGSGEPITGPINTDNYLTILALEDGLTASLSTNTCQYCVDGDGNWIDLPSGTTTQSINQGQTLSFKGNLTPASYTGIGTFTINKKCNLEGNCMSMLFGDYAANNNNLYGKDYAFYYLFSGCTTIIEVSETFLPATTLVSNCYQYMFRGCTSLTTAPELPATRLANNCYNRMFYGCTSLTTAPVLPATTLVSNCYNSMFSGCTSLTTAPELPATTLDSKCYQYMFKDCSNLNYIKMLATDISASSCLTDWVLGVSSTGTFVKNPDMTSLPIGVDGIPSGWTVVDDTTNVIYYTSTDGNVVTPYATDVFGANIVSNTYSDGKGVITFDGDVTSIGDRAFRDCDSLTSVIIPDSVTTIGRSAFYNCNSLTSVTIPNGVTNIGYGAFNYCTNLTNASLPDSVTNIGYGAFSSTRLTSITIPYSVTGIEGFAFGDCTSLTSVYCKATTPPTLGNNNVFDSNASGRKIYAPYQSLDVYKTATNWSEYADDIVGYDFENDVVIITFTVNGAAYQAEEGMTWQEWCDSSYNVINAAIYGTRISVPIENIYGYIYDSESFSSVSPTQEIIVNHSYTLSDPTAGN